MKVKVPYSRILQNFGPGLDPWNRRVHYHEALNLVRVHRRIRISHHIADVVRDHECSVISQRGRNSTNVLGLRFLVIPACRF